ncbi:hypothetical protein FGB62_101g09 [Gracilaria domingensis]|nr:hypothetical protein FGB62_101g09 [Gracilaria domingensis]
MLLHPEGSGEPSVTTLSKDTMRTVAEGGDEAKCDLLPIDRTITVGAAFEGPEEDEGYVDTRNDFFRFGLGWDEERIERSRVYALKHFNDSFGVDASSLDLDSASGVYGTEEFGYAVIVLNLTLVRTADSGELTPCTNVTGVVGGWVLFGVNITYPTVPGVSGSQNVAGESGLFVFYLVAQPGTRTSTKIEMKGTRPLVCILKMCPITADTQIIDDADNTDTGNLDGVFLEEEFVPGIGREYVRWVLTFPGRG